MLHITSHRCIGIPTSNNIGDTVKPLNQAHALIEAHSQVWTPKVPIFQANFPKNRASNNGTPMKILKNRSYVMQKHLEFVISSEFLVVHLQ